MAIDLGASNTSRWYTVPDHSDFSLPNGDWAWVALVYPQTVTAIKYIVSTGNYGAANAFNLVVYNTASGVGAALKVDTLTEAAASAPVTHDKHYCIYGTRRSNMLYVGQIAVGDSTVSESTGLPISAGYNSTVGPEIGRRTDGNSTRYWQGRWSQIAFISGSAMTPSLAMALANGAPLLAMPFAPNIKFLLHGRTAAPTITDLIGRKGATRQGTGYGTNEADTLTPYLWLPTYIRGASSSVHNLASANATQTNAGGTGSVSQAHTLTPDPATQVNLASEPEVILGATAMLAADNAEQANASESVGVTQAHSLVHAPSIQDNIAAESAVVHEHILTATNAAQANASSTPAVAVISTNDLAVDPITQGNIAATGRVARTQTLTASSATQVNRASTGALSAGIIFEAALASITGEAGIKKPGIPHDAPAWLRTTLETVIGRRGNRIAVPAEQDLTFSSTPTQAEMEAFYNYTNTIRNAVEQLIERLDS